MRIILSIISVVILFSSCITTHTNTVINEPAFEKKGELQITATVAPDNIEGQAAYAFSKNFGVIGNAYRGFSTPLFHKNTNIYEVGINHFRPTSKIGYFSYTLGLLSGRNNKKGSSVIFKDSKGFPAFSYEVDANYRGSFAQISYIKKELHRNSKTMFTLKGEYINVSNYQLRVRESGGVENPQEFSNYLLQDKNRDVYQFRVAATHQAPTLISNVFVRAQVGYTYTTGFTTKNVELVNSTTNIYEGYYYRTLKQMRPRNLFFNILLEVKF